jgi:surface polysaccharide O-acyltransferase-like enzyme
MTTLQMIFQVFDLVFDFWPVLVLGALRGRGNLLRNLLVTWLFWAVIRVFLFFNPEPMVNSMLIPEPLSTLLFFGVGVILAGVWLGVRLLGERS